MTELRHNPRILGKIGIWVGFLEAEASRPGWATDMLSMDNLIRFAAFLILGGVLVLFNIWYFRSLFSIFWPSEYVIMPIKVAGKEDKDGALGILLAQMLQARLEVIERDLADSQRQLTTTRPGQRIATRSLPVGSIAIVPLISAETVKTPTSLFERADIDVSVGGVNVTGAVAWIQNLLVKQRMLNFTIYTADSNRTIVTGDATALGGGANGPISFESTGSEDKVISHLAYALLLRHITSTGGNRIDGLLSVEDFEALADGLRQAVTLNQRIALGGQPTAEEFGSIFRRLGPIALKVAGWPELKYFAANLAKQANENKEAVQLYTELKEARSLPGTSAEVRRLIDDGTVDAEMTALSSPSPTGTEQAGKFDMPVTMQGSTAHADVYYETALGGDGSKVAVAVLDRFGRDFAKLAEFFGGIAPSKPFNIIVAAIGGAKDGTGGAYHYGCAAQDIYVDVKMEPVIDTDLTNFLIVTQAVDVFGAVQNKGWDCGASNGAGLKRVLANELYPKQTIYSAAAAWLDSHDRPDYVNTNGETEWNPVSTGCAVLFLNYMHDQLNIGWERIVQAGGPTLGQTYSNLGLGNDGFIKFKRLMDTHFPIGKKSGLATDNPFPR